ncbi:hypothetical protein B296_00049354 [Ensete ventricosum]|uniref:Uncharacterized protein n=1 Tax=Ensete ventricosum TaxID=4639 RepID=A0A426Y6T4_ENSVE|nr:hypothetical protein B296_00049354 [Ensete ventricosum]
MGYEDLGRQDVEILCQRQVQNPPPELLGCLGVIPDFGRVQEVRPLSSHHGTRILWGPIGHLKDVVAFVILADPCAAQILHRPQSGVGGGRTLLSLNHQPLFPSSPSGAPLTMTGLVLPHCYLDPLPGSASSRLVGSRTPDEPLGRSLHTDFLHFRWRVFGSSSRSVLPARHPRLSA